MSAAEKAAQVMAAHEDPTGWTWDNDDLLAYECNCGDRAPALSRDLIHPEDVETAAAWHRAHVAQALADAGLLIAAFPDGSAGTLTGDLLTDMAAYAGRLKDRAEAVERALATLREDVAREIEADRSLPWNAMHHEALRAAARIARGPR